MPGNAKDIIHHQHARRKALGQRVYISGLQGSHTLEVGVAYHYRGHFIYAYPAGNPIEPVPFSTKKGINIVGVVQDRAPIYDPQAPDLVPEDQIAALHRACIHEQDFQKELEKIRKQAVQDALDDEAKQESEKATVSTEGIDTTTTLEPSLTEPLASHPLRRATSFPTLPVLKQVVSRHGSHTPISSLEAPADTTAASLSNIPKINTFQPPSAPSITAHAPQTSPTGQIFTPHDRGRYLAHSAPGSRQGSISNTPYTSRAVSPTHGLSVRGYGAHLRPNASTSRLNQLLAEEGVHRAFTPISEVPERVSSRRAVAWEDELATNMAMEQDWIDPDEIDAFVQTVSRQPSRPASRPSSRPLSRTHSSRAATPDDGEDGLHLPGLGHPDVLRTTSRSRSPLREGQMVGGRYLPGLGHPDILHSVDMRSTIRSIDNLPFKYPEYALPADYDRDYILEEEKEEAEADNPPPNLPSRTCTPFPDQTYDSENSATYLRRLAKHNYTQGGPLSRATTPSTQRPSNDSPRISPNNPQKSHTETFTFPHLNDRDRDEPTPSFTTKSTITGGRSRAASLALNEAYNAAHPPVGSARTPKCAIHDGACDGLATTEKYVTQRAREGAGFVDLYPTAEGVGGVVVVDWYGIYREMMGTREEG